MRTARPFVAYGALIGASLGLMACGAGSSVDDGFPDDGSEDDVGGQAGGGQGGEGPIDAAVPLDSAQMDPSLLPTTDFGMQTRPENTTCLATLWEAGGQPQMPEKLSETGCFRKEDPSKPTAGLIPYGVNAALWSDGATKQRWMALPAGRSIQLTATGDFDFPPGSVLLKTFALDDVRLETRFLVRHSKGDWAGYTYVWDEAGKDAKLLGIDTDYRDVNGQEWVFPSRKDCLECHTEAAGRALGPEALQLDGVFTYAEGMRANQMKTLGHIGVLEMPGAGAPPALARPENPLSGSVADRARSYLHANCAQCHRPGGAKDVSLDMRFETPLADMGLCNVKPSKNNYGLEDVKLLSPADPDNSMILVRMKSTVPSVRMPQIGTQVADMAGVALIEEWVRQIEACP